jgi:hypothetical protein
MTKGRSIWKPFLSAIGFAALLTCGFSYSLQDQQSALAARQQAIENKQFETAANKWMKVPVDVRTQADPIPSNHRQARDVHWDSLIGASVPLTDPSAYARPLPQPFEVISQPEFGDLDDGVLIIGKFETYRAILSASHRSVYSEIQLRVQHVFGHPDAPIREEDVIDLIRPGGTIIAPWGSTISFGLHPQQMGLQPAHTYLAGIGYHADGNFYTMGTVPAELWDLTDGTVKPGSFLQKARAEQGTSEINGLRVGAVTLLLDKKYQDYYRGGR